MAARLGYILYWIGCGAAVAVLALAYWLGAHEGASQKIGEVLFSIIILAAAAIPWLIGWCCRYVLSGD